MFESGITDSVYLDSMFCLSLKRLHLCDCRDALWGGKWRDNIVIRGLEKVKSLFDKLDNR